MIIPHSRPPRINFTLRPHKREAAARRKKQFLLPIKMLSLALAPSSFLLRYEIKDIKAQQMEIFQRLRIGPEVTFCCCAHMQHHSLKGRLRISPSGGSKRAGSRLQYKEGPL